MRFPTLQNDKNILTSEIRGIVLGFLFLPTCPPRQRFLYRRTEKKKPTHRAGLDIPASMDLASLAEKGIKRKEKWGYGFRLSRPLAAYMTGLPARLRDRRLRRFLLGFLPVYIIAQNNINIL